MPWWLRRAQAFALAVAIVLIAGCAHSTRARDSNDANNQWQGRLVLIVRSEPVQSFSADFELQGTPQAGELAFFSPLGSTVARLQWGGGGAVLQASGKTERFDTLDELTLHTTGAVLPVASLFAWLQGQAPETPGWQVDLQGLPDGRLNAQRWAPEPPAQLKIILER